MKKEKKRKKKIAISLFVRHHNEPFGGVRRTLQVELLGYFGQVMIRIFLSKIMLVLCYGVNMVLYACLLSS